MTKEKDRVDLARWVICILAALAFGAYLGSPAPKVWAQPVSEVMTAVSEQITRMEILHNETANDKLTSKDKTIDESLPAEEGLLANTATAASKEDLLQAADSDSQSADDSIEMIVSEPPAEENPDYVLTNANRGGVADRKEKDVLIHLINAEAYGLSYKAKLAVGQVVMNRWTGPYYGDNLMAIMTAPHQFTPIYNGSAYEKEIEEDSIKAANAVLSGTGVKELTDDTYYFVNPDFTTDKTIEQKMEFVCEIEGIHFFKPPAK